MADQNTKIELIKEMIGFQKELKKKYNHLVDTNHKILGPEKLEKIAGQGIQMPVELVTTLHIGSASIICAGIGAFLKKNSSQVEIDLGVSSPRNS